MQKRSSKTGRFVKGKTRRGKGKIIVHGRFAEGKTRRGKGKIIVHQTRWKK